MNLKGLLLAFFALIFWSKSHSSEKGTPGDFSPFENLAKYYQPLLKTTPALAHAGEDLSEEKIKGLFRELQSQMRIELNSDVLSYIEHYTTGQKSNFEVALSLGSLYNSMILNELDSRSMPRELVYLPLSLTGMHNQAITPNNGTGIWGLNYYTSIKAGLNISHYADDRKNPTKATKYALNYLQELYNEYKSWNVAITAFATSKALVNKAIKKSGGKTNYWEIAGFLPVESRNIIPSFFASVYLASFFPEHDMNPPGLLISSEKELLVIKEEVSLEVLAKELKVSAQTLQLMNPTFRGNVITPTKTSGIDFFIPEGFTVQVAAVETALYSETKKITAPKKVVPKRPPVVIPKGKEKIIYIVKSGDYLGKIAEKHRTRVSYIKRWNYMRSDRINIGQRLVIYVDPNMKKTVATKPKPKVATLNIPANKLMSYTVKNGDTLWDIAKNNPGNDINMILKINGISDKIKPGQVIKILKP